MYKQCVFSLRIVQPQNWNQVIFYSFNYLHFELFSWESGHVIKKLKLLITAILFKSWREEPEVTPSPSDDLLQRMNSSFGSDLQLKVSLYTWQWVSLSKWQRHPLNNCITPTVTLPVLSLWEHLDYILLLFPWRYSLHSSSTLFSKVPSQTKQSLHRNDS